METTPKKQKILVIVGPTGAGKTALSLALAHRYNGEVINADSRQVYKGLDIGTEKVSTEEMGDVVHHLLSVVDPQEVYTAVAFKEDAEMAIDAITHRNRLPIIAGGTFFYIDTLLNRHTTPEVAPNPQLRAVLETKDAETLYAELQSKDPHRASTIDRHNKRRLMRALEIVDTLGHVPVSTGSECPYDVLIIGLHVPKEILKERLHTRAKQALDRGLIEETKSLLAQGVTYERLSEIGLEYRLVLEYLDGNLTQEALIQKLGEKNWQYAKRQMVWLKRDESIVWFTPEDTQSIFTAVDTFLDN